MGFSEQLLQLASLLHTCSLRTGQLVKFFTLCNKSRRDRGQKAARHQSEQGSHLRAVQSMGTVKQSAPYSLGHYYNSKQSLHYCHKSVSVRDPGRSKAEQKCNSAPCWPTYRCTVTEGGDALFVVTPLAHVGVGCTAGTV